MTGLPFGPEPLVILGVAGAAALLLAVLARRARRRRAKGDNPFAPGALKAVPVLTPRELDVFRAVEGAIGDTGLRALAQVSLGEVLEVAPRRGRSRGEWRALHNRFNAKRCDILVVREADFAPVLAVEYQGRGHARSGAAEAAGRDAAKRAALASAGIGLLEIAAGTEASEVRADVRAALAGASGAG